MALKMQRKTYISTRRRLWALTGSQTPKRELRVNPFKTTGQSTKCSRKVRPGKKTEKEMTRIQLHGDTSLQCFAVVVNWRMRW